MIRQNGQIVVILPLFLLLLLLGHVSVYAKSTALTPQLVVKQFKFCQELLKFNHHFLLSLLQTQITESLFPANYSSLIRPQFDQDGPVVVNISLEVRSISEVKASGPTGSVHLQLDLWQRWRDDRLNCSLYKSFVDEKSGTNSSYVLRLNRTLSQQLWTPKTYIVDSQVSFGSSEENTEEVRVELNTETVITAKRWVSKIQ